MSEYICEAQVDCYCPATFRVQFGVRDGSWLVCGDHLPALLDRKIEDGMKCSITRARIRPRATVPA